jgi:hypothetical protein
VNPFSVTYDCGEPSCLTYHGCVWQAFYFRTCVRQTSLLTSDRSVLRVSMATLSELASAW